MKVLIVCSGNAMDSTYTDFILHHSFIYEQTEALKKHNIEFENRRNKMLSDKIDVTSFMVWFIENYPGSIKVMKENPDYQDRFK